MASKRKNTLKSKATVIPEEDAAPTDGEDENAANLLNSVRRSQKTAKKTNPKKSHRAAAEPDAALKYEFLDNQGTETRSQDMLVPDLAEFPQMIEKAKNSKLRRAFSGKSTKIRSSQGDNDSAAVSSQPPTLAPIAYTEEHNTSEENVAALSQIGRVARSIARPESINGDETEEPIRPSKTALGKRKAVDEPELRGSSKKSKSRKDKRPQDRDMGSEAFPPSNEASRSQAERDGSTSPNHPRTRVIDLATGLYQETNQISPESAHTLTMAEALLKKAAKKSKPAPSDRENNPKKPRPSWNAVNSPLNRIIRMISISRSPFLSQKRTRRALNPNRNLRRPPQNQVDGVSVVSLLMNMVPRVLRQVTRPVKQ